MACVAAAAPGPRVLGNAQRIGGQARQLGATPEFPWQKIGRVKVFVDGFRHPSLDPAKDNK